MVHIGKLRLTEGHTQPAKVKVILPRPTGFLLYWVGAGSSATLCGCSSEGDSRRCYRFLQGLGTVSSATHPRLLFCQAIGSSIIEISVPNFSQALNICSTLKGTMRPPGLIKTPQKALSWAGLILCFWFFFAHPTPTLLFLLPLWM